MYSRGRFAYLTGHALPPVRLLAERQRLVTLLAQHVCPPRTEPDAGKRLAARPTRRFLPATRNDELFRIARSFVRNGLARARRLSARCSL